MSEKHGRRQAFERRQVVLVNVVKTAFARNIGSALLLQVRRLRLMLDDIPSR